jgi:hypothetical protein
MGFKLIGASRGLGAHGLGLASWSVILAVTIVATPFVIWAVARLAMTVGFWG